MARIVFLTLDGGGNVAPALAIAGELARGGHRVRFLAAPPQLPRLQESGFEAIPYRHARGWNPGEPVSTVAAVNSFSRLLADRGYAADLADAVKAQPADVVVLDALLPAAVAPAKALGVPVVVLMHSFAQFFLRLPGFRAAAALRGVRPAHDWAAADAILVASDRELDPAGSTSVPANLRWTGVAEPLPRPAAERTGAPRVLVSLSMVAAPGQKRVLQNVLDAVASLPIEVVATTGPTMRPEAFRAGSNTRILPSVPHGEVLPECSAVVGHGGHSTTMRALLHGLPLVMLPCDTRIDQPMVAAAVARAGAGIALRKSASPDRIRGAVASILENPSYRQAAAELGARLRAEQGARRGAEAVLAAAVSVAAV